jgi:hypothetical protein
MKNFSLIILAALGILLIIGYEELGLDIGIGVKNQIVVGTVFLITAIALTFYFKAPKKNLNTKGPVLNKSKLEELIENDPEIKKLEQEMRDLVDSQLPILLRLKKNNPDLWKLAVEKGLVGANLENEDEESIDESASDSQKQEDKKN